MQNIPTIFIRDKETKELVNKQLRMVDWVFQGRGVPTRKFNGIAIKIEGAKVWRRFEWRQGEKVPAGFIKLADFDPRRPNASIPGWVPVPLTFLSSPINKDEKALREAWNDKCDQLVQAAMLKIQIAEKQRAADPNAKPIIELPYAKPSSQPKVDSPTSGTYELCGPLIRGNPEKLNSHVLYKHGETVISNVPRTFEGLRTFLSTYEGEGIVWHYRINPNITPLMAKIKRRDFGFDQPYQAPAFANGSEVAVKQDQ